MIRSRAVFVLLVVGVMAGGTASAVSAATQLSCGSTISTSVTLTGDVGPCPRDGLIVTADNVTVNFAGHRVFGTAEQGAFAGVRLPKRTGVRLIGPGSIDNFDAGVVIGEGSHNTVRGLSIHDNIASQFVADHPDVGGFGDGIFMISSTDNLVENNQVAHNGPFSGITVASLSDENSLRTGRRARRNVIRGNRVLNNDLPEMCSVNGTTTEYPGRPCVPLTPVFNQDIGIRIEGPEAVENTIVGNTVAGSGRDGISLLSNPNPLSRSNAHNSILNNTVYRNGFTGFDFVGFLMYGSGIDLRCFRSSNPNGCASNNLIQGNRSFGNSASGILLGIYSNRNTVTGNTAIRNNVLNFGATSFNRSWDGEDDTLDPPCDSNTWSNNVLGNGNQACVGAIRTEPPTDSAVAAAAADPAPPAVPLVGRVSLFGRPG